MSDYCLVSDIENWFPGVTFDNTTTKISKNFVRNLITRHSAYIDTRLANAYTVPITGSNSLQLVKEICEYFTIADVENILNTGLGRISDLVKKDYRKLGEQKLKSIENGETELTDAQSNSSSDFYNNNVENSIEFTVKKETKQW